MPSMVFNAFNNSRKRKNSYAPPSGGSECLNPLFRRTAGRQVSVWEAGFPSITGHRVPSASQVGGDGVTDDLPAPPLDSLYSSYIVILA